MKKTAIVVLDRRVKRTRERLRSALVALILERGWDAVSVINVCQRAEVGRSTFYLHFADKEDLLVSGFDQLLELLHTERRRAVGTFGFAEALLEHARDNARLFRAIVGRKSGQSAQRRMRDVITTLVEAELAVLGIEQAQRGTTAKFLSGGLFELLIAWLESSRKVDARTLAATFRRLTKGALGSVGDGS